MSGQFNDDLDDIPAAPTPEPKAPAKAPPKKKVSLIAEAQSETGVYTPAALSEDDIADHFCHGFSAHWKWVEMWGYWMRFDPETGWYKDIKREIDREIAEYCRTVIFWKAAEGLTWAEKKKFGSSRLHSSVKELCKSDKRMAGTPYQWDTDDYLLGIPGGHVDLKSGTVIKADPEAFISRRCRVAPDFDMLTPVWTAIMQNFMQGSEAKIDYLRRLFAVCLSGETSDQAFAFLFGKGQVGKGTFLRTLMEILGSGTERGYASICAEATFMVRPHGDAHLTEIAALQGMRLVGIDETSEGMTLNEGRIKWITGGNLLKARLMRQDEFEFKPKFKIIMVGNHKPILKGVGKEMERRLHLVECLAKVDDSQRDDDLGDKIRAEYPGILAWAIRGFARWQKDRLRPPAEIREATATYLEEEDVISDWIDERCTRNPGGRIKRTIAYKDFDTFYAARGYRMPMLSRQFFEKLRLKEFKVDLKSSGDHYIVGLELKQKDAPSGWGADRD